MGVLAMREFFGAIKIHASQRNVAQVLFLFGCAFKFLGRKAWHEFLWPSKCGTCRGPVKVYFLRSPANVIGLGSETDLSDWLVCNDDDCREAQRLN